MMDLIVIENSNQRCHLSGKVVLRREIIYNGSTPFNLDQLNDKYVYRVQYFRNIGYVEGEEFTPTSLFGSFIECESE